jgi:hypothetical protein
MEGTMTTTPRLSKSLTQVNTTDGGAAQNDGQVVSLNDGGYVVVWTNIRVVVGQRYDSAGNKVGGEVDLTEFHLGDQSSPSVTLLDDGNIAVAYVNLFGGNRDIYVRIVDSSFVFNSSLTVLRFDDIDVSANQTFDPSITALAGGSYAVSYSVGTGADTDIVGRIVSATGVVGMQFDIDNQTDIRGFSELATLSNGNFVAVYQDQVGGSLTNTDCKFAIVSPAGAVTVSGTIQAASGPGLEIDPDVAALRDGGFVAVWTDPDSTVNDIRATIYSNTGFPVLSNIVVNTTTTGEQNRASVVALADGGFLVNWEDDNANLVRAQRFDAVGHKIGTEFTVKNGVATHGPEAAILTDGRIAYAVNDGDPSSADDDVMTSIWRARDVSHDFDGDGKSGVLWRHDSGQVYFWEMDGLQIKAEGAAAHALVPTDWHIQDIGDYNADGKSDILWRHDSGQVYLWEMNGLQITAEGAVSHAPVPSDWHIFSQHNFV